MTLIALVFSIHGNAQQPEQSGRNVLPTIPVGLDAYRMWDKWPQQRIGVRAYMRSTYDRAGGNESADASHFLFAKGEDYNVTLDVKGTGIMYFCRANHWHGSPWHFNADGNDNIIRESGTSDPVNAKKVFKETVFLPTEAFPQPLNWTWAITKGADLIWTPMPFKETFQIAYSRTKYGTGYYIYNLFANEQNLSQPIQTWNSGQTPAQDVLDLIGLAGTDIAPRGIKKLDGKIKLDKKSLMLANIKEPSSIIRAFKMILPLEKAVDLERLRLLVTWDNSKYPSIDAPLCLFFGAGTFYNRESKEYLVKGFPIYIRYDYPNRKVELACYFPMPFFRSAKYELAGIQPDDSEISYEIRYEPLAGSKNFSSYFHATYKDIPTPEPGKDMVYLDTRGLEGKNEWSGSFVGTSFIFSHNGFLGTLEGDPRFFLDDSQTPQAYGTGTEEWGGGGDYWGGQNMTLPFAGHPCGTTGKDKAKDPKDLIESAYRFLLADLMPFGRRAVIRFEHGGENLSTEHYEAVTYWYGLPSPSLIKTDEVDVGNLKSENEHAYISPDASEVETISSRYEWGIDVFPKKIQNPGPNAISGYDNLTGKDVYPEQSKDGRFMRGTSEFTVKLKPDNEGVLLRRTLDYRFPNQTAEVYISGPGANDSFEKAGVWYLAGSNTCLFSNPPGELDNRKLKVQTSNRRLRDDEFLIPSNLTKGKGKIKIRVTFIPNFQELFPGTSFPVKSAWSELGYEVYCYIKPAK